MSKNSIMKSQQRCVVIDGSSNMTLSENVANEYIGQCFYFGPNATDISILNNYASNGKGKGGGLSDDNQGTSFRQINGPNNFDGNVAIGNDHNGFKLNHAHRVQREDGSYSSTDPRWYQFGDFKNNIAAGNGHSGFIFETNFQRERVAFQNLLAYNNRYYGKNVYKLYGIHKLSMQKSYANSFLHSSKQVFISGMFVEFPLKIVNALEMGTGFR